MSGEKETVKANCNQCLGSTRHFVIASRVQEFVDELPDGSIAYHETTKYEMLECCGCDKITLRSISENSGEPEPTVVYFPPAVTRREPAWFSDWSFHFKHQTLRSLFHEVYAALHAGSNRLAMMGARAIVDVLMLDRIGDVGTFAEKLKKMETEGLISGTNRAYLEAAIDAGSAASHRGHRHDDADVNRVMDIVENVVQSLYVLDRSADALRQNTPRRDHKTSSRPAS